MLALTCAFLRLQLNLRPILYLIPTKPLANMRKIRLGKKIMTLLAWFISKCINNTLASAFKELGQGTSLNKSLVVSFERSTHE